MVKTRRGDDLTKSSHKSKRACNAGETGEPLLISGNIHMDSNQDVFSKISDEVASDLRKSVVSIAFSSEDAVLFSCSGIAIEHQGFVTRFLTSASLVRAIDGARKGNYNYRIEVRHGGNEVHRGFLSDYDFAHNFAVINVMTFLDVHVVLLKRAEEILPHSNAVAVGRDISGNLITRSVILTDDLSKAEDSEWLMHSTRDSEAWEGGPLFDFDGNFVGMNVILVIERSFFLPWRILISQLEHIWTSLEGKKCVPHLKNSKAGRLGERPTGDISNCHPDVEEPFGDVFGQGIWRGLSKRASTNIQRNVVALASFNGETRFFACTGFFIEWNQSTTILTSASLVRSSGYENRIKENLRIEVHANGRRMEGTLQHYSLHYNVALVSVKDYRALRPANIQLRAYDFRKVAAVGRCFKSGQLMAANGVLVSWTGTLDCRLLVRSSCKISKAGIGGPLVNFNGEVVGMNFYDKKIGTPFLLWDKILKILEHFKDTGKSTAVEAGNGADPSAVPFWKMAGDPSDRPYRWPVRTACWRRCDDLDDDNSWEDDESEDEDESEGECGHVGRYTYKNGKRCRLR